jgi:predicted dehydrogenase
MKRRDFLKGSLGAIAAGSFPLVVPSRVLGRLGTAPSDRIVMACIGVGWQGTSNMQRFLREDDCQVVAVCDIDKEHLEEARNIVNKSYGNEDCQTYHLFEEVIARDDIDAVSLGLPDHWHAIPAILAAKSGKDAFGEKPLSHSLVEGRAMCDAIHRYGRVWQTGSWQRSEANFRFGAQLVINGRIGKVHTVEVGLPAGHTDFEGSGELRAFTDPPDVLDYQRWLGPAPYAPYAPCRVHKNWRWNYDYGGGQLMDWVGHHVDIAHWGLGLDRTGPVEVECQGDMDQPDPIWNTAKIYRGEVLYANGVKMILGGGHDDIADGRSGTKWIGDEGWVWVSRDGIDADPKSLLREKFGANEIHLYKSPGHWRDFLNCIKSRQETITPVEVAHRSASVGHLALVSMKLGGRRLKWDPEKEIFPNDDEANRLLSRAYRSPWHLT